MRASVAIAVVGAGCWVPIEKGTQMETQIRALEAKSRDNAEATQRAAVEQEQRFREAMRKLEELSTKVAADSARLQAKIDELNRIATRTGANLGADMEKALQEIATLRGEHEERAHEIENLRKELRALRDTLEPRLAKLEEKARPPPEPTKQDLYDEALKKLESGDTVGARARFVAFREKFKGDPLAANAQYWLAETYYAEGKYREAIVEFQRVQAEYKTSEKAPDALLKTGLSFVNLGMKDDGVLFLEEVQRQHPKSPAAERARAKLKELRAGKNKKKS